MLHSLNKLAQYFEPHGKAPQASVLCLPSSGFTVHCPYLSLEGDPSGRNYNLAVDKAAYKHNNIQFVGNFAIIIANIFVSAIPMLPGRNQSKKEDVVKNAFCH